MSLTSYRAAPPRVGVWWCGCGRWVVMWCGGDNCRLTTADCALMLGLADLAAADCPAAWAAVSWALEGFTAEFGMGSGGAPSAKATRSAKPCRHRAAVISTLRGRRGWGACVACACVHVGAWGEAGWPGLGARAPETWAHLGAGREAEERCRISGFGRADWAIRTARLSALPRVHLRPIDVMVYHGPRGDLVLRRGSRLDAFSGYPGRTWLPGGAAGATTGAPEVRPPRSSRTGGSASQVSHTHGR